MKLDTDYIFDKSSLNVSYPQVGTVKNVMTAYQSYLFNTQDLINETNDSYLGYLDNIASFNQVALKDLKTMYSLLGDLYVLNGRTSKSVDIFELSKHIFSNTSMRVNPSSDEIKISSQDNYSDDFVTSKLSIRDVRVAPRVGDQINKDIFIGRYKENKNNELSNILTKEYELTIHSVDKPLVFSLVIDLGDIKPVNMVSFSIDTKLIPYVSIKGLEVSQNNSYVPIRISNSDANTATAYNVLDISGPIKSTLLIDFDNQLTRFIKVDLSCSNFEIINARRVFSLTLNGLKTGFYVPNETGSVVFGPIKFTDEVLKLSIDSVLENYNIDEPNINLSISNEKNGGFQPLINSIEFNPDTTTKNIVNYNNISLDSVNTQNPVKEIYLKVDMTSIKAKLADIVNVNIMDIESYIQRNRISLGRTSRTVFVAQGANNKDSFSVLRELKGYSGYNTILSAGDLISTANLVQNEKSGEIMGSAIYSTTKPSLDLPYFVVAQSNKHRFVTKPERTFLRITEKTSCYPRFGYDKYRIQLFGYSLPILTNYSGNSEISNNRFYISNIEPSFYCLPLKIKAGRYKLQLNESDYVMLDFSSGFIQSVTETHFLIEKDDITTYTLTNEVGEIIGTGPIATLGDIKYISIFDDLIDSSKIPVIAGFVFNKIFGISPNGNSQFSLVAKGLIFNQPFIGDISNLYKIIKTQLNKFFFGIQLVLENKKVLKIEETLTESSYRYSYKLSHTRIVPGSIEFNAESAAINPFILEVNYENGKKEFVIPEVTRQEGNTGLNEISLSSFFVGDESAPILFDGENDLFVNRVFSSEELISRGDWYFNRTDLKIELPDGVSTSDTFDTAIIYNIRGRLNSYGLYSVDYFNGIIYTNAPMDSSIKIKYLTSYVFATYEHFEEIDNSKFNLKDGQLSIVETNENNKNDYLIIYNRLNDVSPDKEILVSPKIKNLKINVLTKEEIL